MAVKDKLIVTLLEAIWELDEKTAENIGADGLIRRLQAWRTDTASERESRRAIDTAITRIIEAHPDRIVAVDLLGSLAFWIHISFPMGRVSENEVRQQIANLLTGDKNKAPYYPEIAKEADEFLEQTQIHTGLFGQRSPGFYGFAHPLFEVYFVAKEILKRNNPEQFICTNRHNPRWQEPILFAISILSSEDAQSATDLIETAILARGERAKTCDCVPSECEDILHRDLMFAVRCIGNCSHVPDFFQQEVLTKLFHLYFHSEVGVLRAPIRNVLPSLNGTKVGKEVGSLLFSHFSNEHEDVNVQSRAAEALGSMAVTNSDVATLLLQVLNDKSEEDYVRWFAAEALENAAGTNGAVVNSYFQAVKDKKEDERIRGSAAEGLKSVAGTNHEVADVLLQILNDKEDVSYVRYYVAYALGSALSAHGGVTSALMQILNDKNDNADVRKSAAQTLMDTAETNTEVVNTLLQILSDKQEDHYLRKCATGELGKIAHKSPVIASALLQILHDKNDKIRGSAAFALRSVTSTSGMVVNTLIQLLNERSEHLFVRMGAANALSGATGMLSVVGTYGEVGSALLQVLNDKHDDAIVRGHAALSLGCMAGTNRDIARALLQTINDKYENECVSRFAAEVLGNHFQSMMRNHLLPKPIVIKALKKLMERYQAADDTVAYNDAWEALWKVCSA